MRRWRQLRRWWENFMKRTEATWSIPAFEKKVANASQLVYLKKKIPKPAIPKYTFAATVSSGWNRGRLATIIDYFILRLWKITSCCKCLVVVLFDEIKWQKAPRLDTNSMMNSVRRRQQSTNYAASYCKCSKQKQIYNHVIVPLASETNPIPFRFRWFFIRCTSLRRLLRTHWPG